MKLIVIVHSWLMIGLEDLGDPRSHIFRHTINQHDQIRPRWLVDWSNMGYLLMTKSITDEVEFIHLMTNNDSFENFATSLSMMILRKFFYSNKGILWEDFDLQVVASFFQSIIRSKNPCILRFSRSNLVPDL